MRLCPNWPSISDICIECLIPLRQETFENVHRWKLNKCNQCDSASSQVVKFVIHLKLIGRKSISTTKDFWKYTCYACGCGILISQVTQFQSVWLLIFSSWHFEGTFSNTQWGEVKQMQLMWICILSDKRFENTFKNITRGETSKDITSFSILTYFTLPFSALH